MPSAVADACLVVPVLCDAWLLPLSVWPTHTNTRSTWRALQALLPVALQLHMLYQPSPLLPTAPCRVHRHPWAMLVGSLLLAGEVIRDMGGRLLAQLHAFCVLRCLNVWDSLHPCVFNVSLCPHESSAHTGMPTPAAHHPQ